MPDEARLIDASTFSETTIRARVDAVLADSLYWFPVRHHSPAVARYLEAAIEKRSPKTIFIEGPSEANDLMPHVVDVKTKPPIAIYSSYRDDANLLGLAGIASASTDIAPRFACWYPMLAYSPEYVAMMAAKRIGADVVFMDLPHYALIKPASAIAGPKAAALEGRGNEDEMDRLIFESSFYQALAKSAGYRSWEEGWDSLFEAREFGDIEEFRRELAYFCCAARATTSSRRIQTDGTLERERFMDKTIRETLAARRIKPKDALVVCGGFHLFMDRDDTTPPPVPPAGTVYTAVVPYSFFRVSELSGYAAGNRAPQFYQLGWDLRRDGRADDLLVEHVVAVSKQMRQDRESASSADAISTCEHAIMLARLRGRATPILDDMNDALISCCCKGDPADDGLPLLKAMDAVGIGTRIGRVTDKMGRLPVVGDFYALLDSLDLGQVLGKEKRLIVALDKRDPEAAMRSVFLQRLRFLEVPLASMADAPSGDFATGQIFREKWELRWSPQVEPALIELSLHGDTVEAAVLTKLREELAKNELNAGKACQRLVQSIDMDLPDLVRHLEGSCSQAIDQDKRFSSLSEALANLLVIDRYAVFRNLRRDILEELIERCFDRACFALPDASSAPPEQQAEVVNALLQLAEAVLRGNRPGLERSLFAEHVRKAVEMTTVPLLRGAFLGMLTEIRELTPEALAAEVSALAKAPVEQMTTAGDFLDGAMATSRTSILLGADALVGAIDELLRAAEWDSFLVMLPRMRAAVERLHERQRDSLASKVAERYGLAESESLTELRTSVAAAALIAQIDQQVAKIMDKWRL